MTAVSLTEAVGPAVPITTGAEPVTADANVQVYAVTTGGTAGQEIIDLLAAEPITDGWANGQIIGRQVVFYLAEQTDPADTVKITADGGSSIASYHTLDRGENANSFRNVVLDFVGAAVCFKWANDVWTIDARITDGCFTAIREGGAYLLGSDAQSGSNDQGELAQVKGGNAAGTGTGGEARLQGGNGSASGAGGNVRIAPGSGGGVYANVLVEHLPTSDPAVVNALWNDSGTLKVSAG